MSSNRIPTRAIARMIDSRWAMRPDQLELMLSIANRQDLDMRGLGALADKVPQYKESADGETGYYTRGNVGIINVTGPCFRYSNLFTEFCGATSYDAIARQVSAIREDRAVEAVIMVYDTPGGEVTGCAETAAKVKALSKEKPVIAYVDGDACSAGYWLAAACDHIVASSTSVIGCLGVVGVYTDRSAADEKEGLKSYEIVSSLTPNKRPDINSDSGRAQLLRMIDATADVFLGDVATYRGISGGPKAVAKRFGGGDVYVGQHAVDIGLADEIGSFEDVLASLSPDTKKVA